MKKLKIGFDIGNNSLKVAVAKNKEICFHEIRMPEHMVENGEISMPNAFSDFLKKTRRELKLPKGPGGLVLPAGQVICRLVTMPRMTKEQLHMNLPYEFNDFIHGEPEQYFCDYALCEEPENEDAPGEMTLMAAAASKRQLYEYIHMFAQAGFSLKVLLPQEMSLIELVKHYCKQNPGAEKEYCFVDLGQASTQVTVVSGDRVQAMRQIAIGVRDLDAIVSDQLGIDDFLADSYKRRNYEDILYHERCREIYDQVAVELLKVVNFYHFTFRENRLSGVVLCGGGARIEPLREAIKGALELPLLPAEQFLPGQKPGEDCQAGFLAAGMLLAKEGKK